MMSPKLANNEHIWKRIDALLDSSVDLDQLSILETEMFPQSEKVTPACSALLSRVEIYAKNNAKKIQEAHDLILAMR